MKDAGWKHATLKDGDKHPTCNYCGKVSKGGITRLKHHWARDHVGIEACSKVPQNVADEWIEFFKGAVVKKARRNELLGDIGKGPGADFSEGIEECEILHGGANNPIGNTRGTMDTYVSKEAKQTTIDQPYKKELRKEVCRKIGRLFYDKSLPFNTVNSPFWKPAVAGIAEYGPGFMPPTMYELRTWILKAEVDDIGTYLESHKRVWKEYGCSIMSDGWTNDKKKTTLINFLVNSPAGTVYLKSIDASEVVKSGELMFNYLNAIVELVGEENVVQVITDSAPNMKNAGKRLMNVRSKLWWTPCAAHCIDLMLKDIGEMHVFKDTLQKSKWGVKFLYGHTFVLSMMRRFTKQREIVRPAITRFATSFLTLQSLYKQKRALIEMFTSKEWDECSYSKTAEGLATKRTFLYDPNFWCRVAFCIRAVIPLVSVLREVDGESRPAMGFIYELMDKAKEMIAVNLNQNADKIKKIWDVIDARWTPQLHQPLHAAAYFLNPQLRYSPNFSSHPEVRKGLYECMDRMLIGEDRMLADLQLDHYEKERGLFSHAMAKATRDKRPPGQWWECYGVETPELMSFAVRVLSLTCSSSGCERNWSTFESIHTKKRNRLEHKRLNALVYVKYNTALRTRAMERARNVDLILVDDIPSDDEWITEREDPVLPTDMSWMDDEDLFDDSAVRSVSVICDANTCDVEGSRGKKKKTVGESSGSSGRKKRDGRKGKGKEQNVVISDNDQETEETRGDMVFDSGNFPSHIDTLDDDDTDFTPVDDFDFQSIDDSLLDFD